MAAGTTRGIQIVLGLWIVGAVLALGWAMVEAGRGPAPAIDVAGESAVTR